MHVIFRYIKVQKFGAMAQSTSKRSLNESFDDVAQSKSPKLVTITGYVSKVPSNVLLSPTKNGKKGVEYFNFCLTTSEKRYRCVSFCKQHMTLLSSLNSNVQHGLMISDYVMDGRDIKLNSNSLLKQVELCVKCDPKGAEQKSLRDILVDVPQNTDVSITCVVKSHSTYDTKNCVVHNYLVSDAGGTLKLSAFEALPLSIDKTYVVEDLTVSSFRNEKILKWMVNSIIKESKKKISESAGNATKFKVKVSSFDKGERTTKCEKCMEDIAPTESMYFCEKCDHVSITAKEELENALITVIHEDDRKQTLTFEDPCIFKAIGDLKNFTVKEYKVLMTSQLEITVDGSKLLSLAMI